MTDNFAEGIIARLQQCSVEQTESIPQGDDKASLTPLHMRLKKLLDTLPSSEKNKGLSLLGIQARLRGRKKTVWRMLES